MDIACCSELIGEKIVLSRQHYGNAGVDVFIMQGGLSNGNAGHVCDAVPWPRCHAARLNAIIPDPHQYTFASPRMTLKK